MNAWAPHRGLARDILVTLHDGVPVPRAIDFGIAKATEGRLADNTVYTQLHQSIGAGHLPRLVDEMISTLGST